MKPFTNLGPALQDSKMVSWNNITNAMYFGLGTGACAKGTYTNPYTLGAKQTDVTTLASFTTDLFNFQLQNPSISVLFVTHRFPTQAVLAVPDDATAYPNRVLQAHL